MDIQESKIALVKTILNIDNIEIIEKITDFINDEFGNDLKSNISSDHNEETEKGIETIIRMVGEFK
ncbi:hypothetical protein [Flavobacterium sp.]|uniref:hypothetical protein n=1 Tax=Flavobacterium sp. TaxID=239 RepID=UPI0038FC9E8C